MNRRADAPDTVQLSRQDLLTIAGIVLSATLTVLSGIWWFTLKTQSDLAAVKTSIEYVNRRIDDLKR